MVYEDSELDPRPPSYYECLQVAVALKYVNGYDNPITIKIILVEPTRKVPSQNNIFVVIWKAWEAHSSFVAISAHTPSGWAILMLIA